MQHSLFDNSGIKQRHKKELNLFISLVKSAVVSNLNYYTYRYSGCCIHSLQLTDGELELIIIEDGNIDIPDERNLKDMIRVGVITISTADSVDSQKLISVITGENLLTFMNRNNMKVL